MTTQSITKSAAEPQAAVAATGHAGPCVRAALTVFGVFHAVRYPPTHVGEFAARKAGQSARDHRVAGPQGTPAKASKRSPRRTSREPREVQRPALVLYGEDDPIVPVKDSAVKSARLIKGAKEIYCPGVPSAPQPLTGIR